jgi:hypothetical protein
VKAILKTCRCHTSREILLSAFPEQILKAVFLAFSRVSRVGIARSGDYFFLLKLQLWVYAGDFQ